MTATWLQGLFVGLGVCKCVWQAWDVDVLASAGGWLTIVDLCIYLMLCVN
jgi:hypothetical protein